LITYHHTLSLHDALPILVPDPNGLFNFVPRDPALFRFWRFICSLSKSAPVRQVSPMDLFECIEAHSGRTFALPFIQSIARQLLRDRKSTRLNSSHLVISY